MSDHLRIENLLFESQDQVVKDLPDHLLTGLQVQGQPDPQDQEADQIHLGLRDPVHQVFHLMIDPKGLIISVLKIDQQVLVKGGQMGLNLSDPEIPDHQDHLALIGKGLKVQDSGVQMKTDPPDLLNQEGKETHLQIVVFRLGIGIHDPNSTGPLAVRILGRVLKTVLDRPVPERVMEKSQF